MMSSNRSNGTPTRRLTAPLSQHQQQQIGAELLSPTPKKQPFVSPSHAPRRSAQLPNVPTSSYDQTLHRGTFTERPKDQTSLNRNGRGNISNVASQLISKPLPTTIESSLVDEAHCLATVASTLSGIIDESIAFSRESELEAMELLDLAVEVLKGVTQHPTSNAYPSDDHHSNNPFAARNNQVLAKVGHLWQQSGVLSTIVRFFSLRLTIGSKLRIAALKSFSAILEMGAASSADDEEKDMILIQSIIADLFQQDRAEGTAHMVTRAFGGGRGSNPFEPKGDTFKNDSDVAYLLLSLACDGTGSTNDTARSAAAEALLNSITAWPFLIQSSLLPALCLPSPTANSLLLDVIGSHPKENEGQRLPHPTLAVMTLLNALAPDAVVSTGLRVQLCALSRLIAKHGPQLLLSSSFFAESDNVITANNNSNNNVNHRTAVQRIISFLDPQTKTNEGLVNALKAIETAVNHGGPLHATEGGGQTSHEGITSIPLSVTQFSLSPSHTASLQHHVRCVVLLLDSLTDLLTASASTLKKQDWSAYWTEVAEVPAVAVAFSRIMNQYLAIGTRSGRDLPPALPNSGWSSSAADMVANDGDGFVLSALGSKKSSAAAIAASTPSSVLTAMNEGLLFTAAISLAKTAILLEGQFNFRQRFPPTAIDGFTSAAPPPPLIMYRLLAGLEESHVMSSAAYAYTPPVPSARVYESYFLRAADLGYFPAAWYKSVVSANGQELSDPTRYHRGIERLRLVRFALSHAFTAGSIQLLESVMGGNGFQHTAQAVSLAQQRLRDQPTSKAKTAVRDILREPTAVAAGGEGLQSTTPPAHKSKFTGEEGNDVAAGNNVATEIGPAPQDGLVRAVVTVMDTCTEALLVEASLLLGLLFAKSPSARAVASYFAVGYESWALSLTAAIESVVVHPKIVAGILQHVVLVDSCQCILNDGEQATHVDRFDEKRIAAAIVREQDKRYLMAEAEETTMQSRGEESEVGEEGHQHAAEEDHDSFAGSLSGKGGRAATESLSRCGSKYHFRHGTGTQGNWFNGKRPPPMPTNSLAAYIFELDLRTVRFLLTQVAEGEPGRIYTRRINELSTRLATEVIVCATNAALVTGPQQLRLRQEQRERQSDADKDNEDEANKDGSLSAIWGAPNPANHSHGSLRDMRSSSGTNKIHSAVTQPIVKATSKRATTPHAKATAFLAQKRPQQTNYDLWLAQRATTPPPAPRGAQAPGGVRHNTPSRTGTPRVAAVSPSASVRTVVGPLTPNKSTGKAPFVPTSTAPKRQLTPSIPKMTHIGEGVNHLGASVAAAFGVPQNATSVQQLMTSAEGSDPAEYLSIAILMHLPITFSPHYQRSQKAAVRHIKSPQGIHYVQPVHRNAQQSWSANDVFIGEVYVLFLPFQRISFERLTEEIETVQRHLLDVKKKLVTTPSTQRSRRWFLSDMLNYVLPKTELLLTTFRSFLDRYSVSDVLYQLTAIRVADEAHLQSESVFGAAVEAADVAMPRDVLRLSSGRFKDVIHSGNIMFAIGQLRDAYQKKETEAALGGGDNRQTFSPTRMREIEREIERLKQMDPVDVQDDVEEGDVFVDAVKGGNDATGPNNEDRSGNLSDPSRGGYFGKKVIEADRAGYKDPYSATDLRRFVDTAYDEL